MRVYARHLLGSPMHLLSSAAVLLLLLHSPTAVAEGNPVNDYYDPNPRVQHRLRTVERHHLPQAEKKLEAGQLRYAEGDILFILRYFPNHPRALLLLAELAAQTGDREIVENRFAIAFRHFPAASNHLVYGIYQHKHGDIDTAIEHYQSALAMNPHLAEAHYNLGLAYVDTERYKLAQQHAQKAYALGYPLPGLRTKLQEVGAWESAGD